MKNKLSNFNILFVIHTRLKTFLQIFGNYTTRRCSILTTVDHPLYPVEGTQSELTIYERQKLRKQIKMLRFPGPYTLNFLKDFLLTIFWGIKTGLIYDLGFGANNLNTLSLLVLKKLGRVKKVIFLSIDYTPHRYDNPLLNMLYHWFDRICCYNVDVIWNSSSRMNEARIKNGVDAKKIVHTIIIPDGSYFDHKKRLPLAKIDRKKIIFLGHMRPVMGVELILKSFKDVLKIVPDAKLLLIGGGPNLEDYKRLAVTLGLVSNVTFAGFIEKHEYVDDLLRTGAIGLAPFAPDKSSYEYYSDVGKPKAYLAAGLPVIITRVPEIANIIAEKKAGITIGYNKKELIDAIMSLLTNDKLYKEYRKNAIVLSQKYIWSNIFTDTYKKTVEFFEKRI